MNETQNATVNKSIMGGQSYNYVTCGDCFSLIKNIPDNSIDVCFTSPPYNRIRNDTYEHFDDIIKDYFVFLKTITDEMLRVAKSRVIVNVQSNHFNKWDIYKFIGEYANNIEGIVVWEKDNPQPATNYREKDHSWSVTNAYEFFIVLSHNGKEFRAFRSHTKNVIHSNVNSTHFKGHGAVMRKEIADWFIDRFTKENDIVLDPFFGTGTTAVSCVEQNRRYIGFELIEEYYKLALDRIKEVSEK